MTDAKNSFCRQHTNWSKFMDDRVIENTAAHRFELAIGDSIAAAYYQLENGKVVLLHTEVPQQLSGQGIGSKLAEGVFRLIRESGRQVIVRCSFMGVWVSRHPEVNDLVSG
jgi:predicted GNAT family acetyltransferase